MQKNCRYEREDVRSGRNEAVAIEHLLWIGQHPKSDPQHRTQDYECDGSHRRPVTFVSTLRNEEHFTDRNYRVFGLRKHNCCQLSLSGHSTSLRRPFAPCRANECYRDVTTDNRKGSLSRWPIQEDMRVKKALTWILVIAGTLLGVLGLASFGL